MKIPEGRFVDVRDANASGRKIQASRVVFPEWKVTATFAYDPEVLDFHNLRRLVETCGARVGVLERIGRNSAALRVVEIADLGEEAIEHANAA